MSESITGQVRIDYWRAHIETWQGSRQSQRAYCAENALNYPQFVYWLRKFRQVEATERGSSGFIPATYVGEAAEGLAVVLPNGVKLQGVNAHNLVVVEQLLSRWP